MQNTFDSLQIMQSSRHFWKKWLLLPWSFVNSTTSSTILVSLLENPGPFGPMISLSVSHLRWRSGSGQNSKTFVMPPANPADPETQLRLGDFFQKKTRFLKARGWFLEWLKTLFHIVLYKSSKGSRWLMWFEIIQSNYWMERRFAFRRWTFGPFCCQRSDFRSLRFGLLRWQQQTIVLSVLTFAETSLVACIYSIVFIYWNKFPWHSEHKFLHSNLCLVCSHNSACRTGWLQAKAGLEGIRGRGPWSVGAGFHQGGCQGQQQHPVENDRLRVYTNKQHGHILWIHMLHISMWHTCRCMYSYSIFHLYIHKDMYPNRICINTILYS